MTTHSLFLRKYLLFFLLLLALSTSALGQSLAVAPSTALSATERRLSESVRLETIREMVSVLSADEMQGRGTAQPGGDKAAQFLADKFARLGLKPLGDKGSYLQSIKFREQQFLSETSLKLGTDTLKLGQDFFITPPYSGDKNVKGDLVFVAYGVATPFLKRNDLQGIDIRGKVAVVLEGPPPEVSKQSWKQAHAQSMILRGLVARGASGIILLNNGPQEHTFSELADYLTRRQVEFADEDEFPDFLPPFLNVSEGTADKLFQASGFTRQQALAKAAVEDFKPMNLQQSAAITIRLKKGTGVSSNVVGILEGTDPQLKSEALIYSAHYDAYGLSADNRIYHGAADNALGVGQMVAIAEVLAKTKLKRSVIFMALTGEEYGGYGSTYWVKNPTWKLKQVAADLNLDGMGTEVYGPVKVVVGYGAEHSSLGSTLNEVAAASGLRVIPDPMPDEKSFYRSDHYFFVKRGIPGIMLMGAPDGEASVWIDRLKQWEKTDYHQPSDVIRPDWHWDGPNTIAKVALVMGLRIANADAMPSWLPNSIFNRERGTDKPAPPEP
jgi:Zn-dependent M28 family amino/carboxypeptidase